MKKLIPYPTKTFTIIILLTLTLLLASINIISNRRIILSFTANANKDITYQVFWTRKDSQSFSEKQSIKQTIKQSDKKIKINIPTKKLARLRLDFGASPEKLTISHLKLKGKNRIIFNDFNKFQLKNINDSKIKEDVLFINSKHHDPYIIYKENISLKAKRYIDWHILIILSTIYFFISYKLVHYLAKFKIEKNNSRIDIIFITIFFALLFIPMLHISDATKSEKENRMLATKPQLSNIHRGGVQLWREV